MLTKTVKQLLVLFIAMFGIAVHTPVVAVAATLNVDRVDDDPMSAACDDIAPNDCSLRGAIIVTNLLGGTNTVNLPGGTYVLTNLALEISGNLTIAGAGAVSTIVDGNMLDRVFVIQPGATAAISGVTITNGSTANIDPRFAVGGGIENNGTLTIADSIIRGNSAPTAGGGGIGNFGVLTVTRSTVTGNVATSGNSPGPDGGGGGILSILGTVVVTESTVSDNIAGDDGGGGIFNFSGVLTVTRSTVRSNTTIGGGGGINDNSGQTTVLDSVVTANHSVAGGGVATILGTVTITNSTISGNSTRCGGGGLLVRGTLAARSSSVINNVTGAGDCGAPGANEPLVNGGGISIDVASGTLVLMNSTVSGNAALGNGGGIYNLGTVELNNVTITGNTADSNGNEVGDGGGVFTAGTVQVRNTIIAGNIDGSPDAKVLDCLGVLTSQGYNLVQATVGCVITGDATGNILPGTDPMLGPLADNGGFTQTHALLVGSPAIDAGNPAAPGSGGNACELSDQRGITRPQDGDGDGTARCDIGAYERSAVAPGTRREPVVLVHGWQGGPAAFGEMATLLEALDGPTRFRPFAFDYAEHTGLIDTDWRIEEIAAELAACITRILSLRDCNTSSPLPLSMQEELAGATAVHVVAHSMGGLVTRAYMSGMAITQSTQSRVSYRNDVARFITLATPHFGVAFVNPGSSIQITEMHYASEFVWELHRGWTDTAYWRNQQNAMMAVVALGDETVTDRASAAYMYGSQVLTRYVHKDHTGIVTHSGVAGVDVCHASYWLVRDFLLGFVVAPTGNGKVQARKREGVTDCPGVDVLRDERWTDQPEESVGSILLRVVDSQTGQVISVPTQIGGGFIDTVPRRSSPETSYPGLDAGTFYLAGVDADRYKLSVVTSQLGAYSDVDLRRLVTIAAGRVTVLGELYPDSPDVNEQNSISGQATRLTSGVDVRGQLLPSGDADWYQIAVGRAGALAIVLTTHSLIDAVIDVFNQAAAAIAGETTRGNIGHLDATREGTDESGTVAVGARGTYYIRVRNASEHQGSFGSYSLVAEFRKR